MNNQTVFDIAINNSNFYIERITQITQKSSFNYGQEHLLNPGGQNLSNSGFWQTEQEDLANNSIKYNITYSIPEYASRKYIKQACRIMPQNFAMSGVSDLKVNNLNNATTIYFNDLNLDEFWAVLRYLVSAEEVN